MSVLCAWLAVLVFATGVAFSVYREAPEYMVEFTLGAMFVIAIWVAVTL